MAITLTDQNFQKEVLKSTLPVLVDFWAPWCGPCQTQEPIIEELAKEFKGKVKIGKLNVEKNPQTASRFQIMSIPTLIIFNNGKPKEQMNGITDKNILKDKLNKLVKNV